jgi:hypothetical protein
MKTVLAAIGLKYSYDNMHKINLRFEASSRGLWSGKKIIIMNRIFTKKCLLLLNLYVKIKLYMMTLSDSIFNLEPLDKGGRVARAGFEYQDHVGASLCIDMLLNDQIQEIWFENHDDISLIYKNPFDVINVEFIQVKSSNLNSRWSINQITHRKDSAIGTSIVEKSFSQYRCSENAFFRIITSYDVSQDLKCLTYSRNTPQRLRQSSNLRKLGIELNKKLKKYKHVSGKNFDYWTKNCYWEKKADSLEGLASINKIILERSLDYLGQKLYSDQRDELYQKLLAKIQNASSNDMKINPNCYKIKRYDLIKWIEHIISSFSNPIGGTAKLMEKLNTAKLSPDIISNATELKWKYKNERLQNDYVQQSDLTLIEGEIISKLLELKCLLDDGSLQDTGSQFHNRCIKEINKILERPRFHNKDYPAFIGKGYMYDLTNKCTHRFVKVEA